MHTTENYPCIAVLMATRNGMYWIREQLDSILNQQNVTVTVYISDDGSSDGTREFIDKLSKSDLRIILLPKIAATGSAGHNFYRLIIDVNIDGFDYFAFADQDDIWHLDKLIRHVRLMKDNQAAAISSNVVAFWEDGDERLIVKSQPQRTLDFLFESAGPGCTFLMTPWLVMRVREQLTEVNSKAKLIALHDWLTYAVCRSYGAKWIIDATPSVQYRQHSNNVLGANVGFMGKFTRLIKLQQGWYRAEVLKISQVCAIISRDSKIESISQWIASRSILSNFMLLRIVGMARRSLIDRLMLALCFAIFIF
jgi:rhamnosyltransferase